MKIEKLLLLLKKFFKIGGLTFLKTFPNLTIRDVVFSNVERMDYEDHLEITESKPLIDYIMSCHGNQNEILGPRLSEFKEYIEELLQNDGKIVVTKQAGLFVCET